MNNWCLVFAQQWPLCQNFCWFLKNVTIVAFSYFLRLFSRRSRNRGGMGQGSSSKARANLKLIQKDLIKPNFWKLSQPKFVAQGKAQSKGSKGLYRFNFFSLIETQACWVLDFGSGSTRACRKCLFLILGARDRDRSNERRLSWGLAQ